MTEGLDAVEYEHALAAASPTRDGLLPALARRPLHPLHRRHHRHAEGRDVARRGHLLRGDGRRELRRPGHRRSPSEIADNVSAAPGVSLALAPLMHGNAQWTMFVGLFGGNTVVLNASRRFDADEIWDLVERESVSVISLVGDAMARPLVDALAHRPVAGDLVRGRLGRRDPLPRRSRPSSTSGRRTSRSSTRSARRRPAPTARSTSPTRARASG